ncbi:MAG: radical SAM family heme chaperone HemW [Cyclobacteriaceae bacterium]
MAGIYIHIPFCQQACHYCDFHFSTNLKLKRQLCDALVKELALQKDYLGNSSIKTIYFGGGTPSLLTQNELSSILNQVSNTFSVAIDAEITLEANPENLDTGYLQFLRSLGINRLSVGIQSFDDITLRKLNRNHDSTSAIDSFQYARKVGFESISIDLIYATDQDDQKWLNDLNKAIDLNPEHISAYCLTIEQKTVFGKWVSKGKMDEVPDDTGARHFEMGHNHLSKAGYEHYEISNFCKPGHYSKHNTAYWSGNHYLGIGPGAHSYNGGSRQFNVSNNPKYIKAICEGIVPFEIEQLSEIDKINEYLMTSLRTKWGVDLDIVKSRFDNTNFDDVLRKLYGFEKRCLLTVTGNKAILTLKGQLLADELTSQLMVTD